MNKSKAILSIFSILYCAVSILSGIVIAIFEGFNSVGPVNPAALLNWLISLAPYILILVYAFAFLDKEKGKLMLIIIIALKLLLFGRSIINILSNSVNYVKYGMTGEFIFKNAISLLSTFWGTAAFVLMLLYILKAMNNKTVVFVISIVYFIFSAIHSVIGNLGSLISVIVQGAPVKYIIFSFALSFLNCIIASVGCAVWIIFTKYAIIRN